jgi:hypothetical protein
VSRACEVVPTSTTVVPRISTVRVTCRLPAGVGGTCDGSTTTASTPSAVESVTVPVPERTPASNWSSTSPTRSRIASRPLLAMATKPTVPSSE